MIRVHRAQPGPAVLSDPASAGPKETKEVIELFERARQTGQEEDQKKAKAFEFKAYKSEDVRRALESMFLGKCAYCESRYAATQPMDVEHWRPKAMIVDEKGVSHGYYWLAASWGNLLPSCIDCNRARNQECAEDGTIKLLGKANRFPLEEGSVRANHPTADDRPLLLNPCNDQPTDHITFSSDSIAKHKTPKGRASIDVYGLNRRGLVTERQQIQKQIEFRFTTIRGLLRVLDDSNSSSSAGNSRWIVEDVLRHEIATLLEFQRRDRPYSLLASELISGFKASLGIPIR